MRIAEVEAETTRALRLAVLRSRNPGYDTAPGDAPGARHVAAFDGDTVVGAVVLLAEPCPTRPDVPAVRLRGMAVAPARQSEGIGALVLDAVLELAAGHDLVWCNARSTARRFYEQHGFVVDGDEFVTGDTGIEHFLMWRNLSAAPPRPTH